MNFPSSPALGQVFTPPTGNVSYMWNGVQWVSTPALPVASVSEQNAGVANFIFLTPYTLANWNVIKKKGSPPPQLYAANETTYTFPHGLGEEPELVSVRMRCKVADGNFTVNQLIPANNLYSVDGAGNDWGISVWYDDTNVYISVDANGIRVRNRDTTVDFGYLGLALNKWDFEVKAWL